MIDRPLPFLAAGVLSAATVVVLLTMPKTSMLDGDGSRPSEETFPVVDAVLLPREQLSRPSLRPVVVYAAVSSACFGRQTGLYSPLWWT